MPANCTFKIAFCKKCATFTLQPIYPLSPSLHYPNHIIITPYTLLHTYIHSAPTITLSFLPHQASF